MASQENSVGAQVWRTSDLTRLRRFLCLGSENGTFYIEEKTLSKENAECIVRMLTDGKGEEVVKEIVNFSREGRAAKQQPGIFALAVCAKLGDLKTKQAAFRALEEVCRIPTHLFYFTAYTRSLSEKTGWGRAQRNAVSRWYNNKEAKALALAVTKYRERKGWSHQDLIKLAHTKPKTDGGKLILKYVSRGLNKLKEDYNDDGLSPELREVMQYLEDVERVKHSKDEHEVAMLVEKQKLCWEHIPTWMRNSKEVWRSLLQNMPMTAMLRNLAKMTQVGILDPTDPDSVAPVVIERLKSETALREAKVHPFTILLAQKTYEKGKGEKSKKVEWKPNPAIVEALNSAFCAAFTNVEPTNKSHLLALDVSSSMQYGGVNGSPQIKPALAAAAMAMVTIRTESNYKLLALTGLQPMVEVNINQEMSLSEIHHTITQIKMGGADCAQPILWALKEKRDVDVFIIYTDCETWSAQETPTDALNKYRKEMNKPQARLVVCALTSSGFTLADPNDPGMLDVVGFDTTTPVVIRNFIMGEL